MNKYTSIFKTSLSQEFAYKLNFIMWRLRNVLQIVIFFSLWTAIFYFNNNNAVLGYSYEKIVAYSFMLIVVRSIVLSNRIIDISGHIANGDLTNYLLRPINYFKYWITRDLSSKFLNLSFSAIEITVLFLIIRPNLYIQTDPVRLLLFVVALCVAVFMYFNILMITNCVPFWTPELNWGAMFLVNMFVEFLSGSTFPLDVFPEVVTKIIKLTPFPYLIYTPIKAYLGQDSLMVTARDLVFGLVWSVVLYLIMKKVWNRGLKLYEGVGK